MTRHTFLWVLVLGLVSSIAVPAGVQSGQSAKPTPESLEQWIRRAYAASAKSWQDANASPEAKGIWREIGWNGYGFGFRTLRSRALTPAQIDTSMGQLGANMEYYRVTLNEVHTAVDGDIGLVWGIHTEDLTIKGRAPESIRVRFTNTLRWNGSTWINLLFHRDAQPFGDDDRYIPKPNQ